MLCKVTHCAGCVATNTRPHQLRWGAMPYLPTWLLAHDLLYDVFDVFVPNWNVNYRIAGNF